MPKPAVKSKRKTPVSKKPLAKASRAPKAKRPAKATAKTKAKVKVKAPSSAKPEVAGLAATGKEPTVKQLRELKKLGIVIHYKGKYFYVFEADWKRRELPPNSSGVAKALVERGTYVAHTGKIAAPLGGWSSLLNLSAVIKGASPE